MPDTNNAWENLLKCAIRASGKMHAEYKRRVLLDLQDQNECWHEVEQMDEAIKEVLALR